MNKAILGLACGLAVALLAAGEASAQERGRGPGGFGFGGGFGGKTFLVRSEQVQTELKISDEQKTKLTAVSDKLREDSRALVPSDTPREDIRKKYEETREQREKLTADAEKKIDEILTAEQSKRLDEIVTQQGGLRSLTTEKVAGKLGLTADQQTKIKGIYEEQGKKMRELFPRPEGGGRPMFQEGAREKMQELNKQTEEQVTAVLTSEQKQKWTDLKGAAFEMRRGGFGGDRRPGEGGTRPRRPNTNNEL